MNAADGFPLCGGRRRSENRAPKASLATGEDQGELEKLKPILGPIIELEVAGEPQG